MAHIRVNGNMGYQSWISLAFIVGGHDFIRWGFSSSFCFALIFFVLLGKILISIFGLMSFRNLVKLHC